MSRRSPVRVGTAGWSIPAREAEHFGMGPSHLARYATRLGMAEINSSFYRSHRAATYERWASAVPAGFRFNVKLPKAITHDARLYRTGALLTRFCDEIAGLGPRLGGVLVQLPPSLVFDARLAGTFFAMMRRRLDAPVAVEARHASWFDPSVDAVWQRYTLNRVAADPARPPASAVVAGAGPVRYWRLHGSPRIYWSPYDDAALHAFAADVRAARDAGHACHVVFDNTASGAAIADALRFKALFEGSGAASPASRRRTRA